MKDRILYYLAAGLSASETARMVGCSASYISQLLKDEAFKEELSQKIKEAPVKEEDSIDARYTSMEMTILNQMKEAIPRAELPHLSQALREVSVAAERREKRRNPLLQQKTVTATTIIEVSLPAHALQQKPVLQLNPANEVVAIDNKPLAPMNNEGVKALFNRIQASKENSNVQTQKLSEGFTESTLPKDF